MTTTATPEAARAHLAACLARELRCHVSDDPLVVAMADVAGELAACVFQMTTTIQNHDCPEHAAAPRRSRERIHFRS